MFKNFITLAYRHFVRSPVTSFIQVFGLTAALTVSILILLWVDHELSYDKFNLHYERIYRLEVSGPNLPARSAHPPTIAPLINDVSGVERVSVFLNRGKERMTQIGPSTKNYFNVDVKYVNNNVFQIFSFDLINGDPTKALITKNSIVLTETLAEALFPGKDPVGETLKDENGAIISVTGVIKDYPDFHIPFHALRSLVTLETYFSFQSWTDAGYILYVLVTPDADIRQLENKITEIRDAHVPKEIVEKWPSTKFNLRHLSQIYFTGHEIFEPGYSKHGNKRRIVAYALVVVFALILACINFINLNTARALERSKEIGIKKVSGASRLSVFLQLFGEVTIICLMALALAMVFAHSMMPNFNQLMDTSVSIHQLFDVWVILWTVFGIIIISLITGGIPAMYLSAIAPINSIKGTIINQTRENRSKGISMLIQFSITILLLIGIITMSRQIHFMKSSERTFNDEQLIFFDFNTQMHPGSADRLKNALLENPEVLQISFNTHGIPGTGAMLRKPLSTMTFNNQDHKWKWAHIDESYDDVLNMELLDGRFFESFRPNDYFQWGQPGVVNLVINEKAMRTMDIKAPIGVTGTWEAQSKEVRIIGVVKDFHFDAMNSEIPPAFLFWSDRGTDQVLMKISSQQLVSTLRFIEEEVQKLTSAKPEIQFVENSLARQYGDDDNFAELLSYLTVLVIVIGSIGLFGIFMHTIQVRIKEIGIRKVLGASLPQIVKLLIGPIFKTIVISSLIAIPLGVMVMNNWLANYPYRIKLDWTIFAVAIGSTILIAMLTIVWQCWQASHQNPARLIRYE